MKKLVVMLCLLGISAGFANEGSCRGQDKNSECKPPKEAIEICKGKATNSTCKMTSPHGDVLNGTCKNTPDEKYFVCIPERGPKGDK